MPAWSRLCDGRGFTVFIAKYGSACPRAALFRASSKVYKSEAQFNLALLFLFSLSVLAAWLGVAAIVGAFLAGMALSETVSTRVHDLAQGINELLVPFSWRVLVCTLIFLCSPVQRQSGSPSEFWSRPF